LLDFARELIQTPLCSMLAFSKAYRKRFRLFEIVMGAIQIQQIAIAGFYIRRSARSLLSAGKP